MILRGNHKSEKSTLNAEVMGKEMGKEVEHGWASSLKNELVLHAKDTGVVPIGVANKSSINYKGKSYTKKRVTHDCSFYRHIRNIRKKPSTEIHLPAVFIRLLYPQNTPHDCSHAPQMAF